MVGGCEWKAYSRRWAQAVSFVDGGQDTSLLPGGSHGLSALPQVLLSPTGSDFLVYLSWMEAFWRLIRPLGVPQKAIICPWEKVEKDLGGRVAGDSWGGRVGTSEAVGASGLWRSRRGWREK